MASNTELFMELHVPYTALKHVFDLLEAKELTTATQVCKTWKEAADQTWAHLADRLYPSSLLRLGDDTYKSYKALVLDDNRRNAALSLQLPVNCSCNWKYNSALRYYQALLHAAQLNEHPNNTHIRLAYDARGETDLRKPSTSHMVLQVVELNAAEQNCIRRSGREMIQPNDGVYRPTLHPASSGGRPASGPAAAILMCAPVSEELLLVSASGHFRGVLGWDASQVVQMKNALAAAQRTLEPRKAKATETAAAGMAAAQGSDAPADENWVFQLVFLYANSVHSVLGTRHTDYLPVLLLEGPLVGRDPLRTAWQHQGMYAAPGAAEGAVHVNGSGATAAATGATESSQSLESKLNAAWAAALPDCIKADGVDWWKDAKPPYMENPVWQQVQAETPVTEHNARLQAALEAMLEDPFGFESQEDEAVEFDMALQFVPEPVGMFEEGVAMDEEELWWEAEGEIYIPPGQDADTDDGEIVDEM